MSEAPRRRGILLVDDNDMDVQLTLEAFAEVGYTDDIWVARSGGHAKAILMSAAASAGEAGDLQDQGATMPELVLLDLKMPASDGFDVLRRIKETPGLRMTPVVILTSSQEAQDLTRCYELGANSYIVKPVSYDEFLEVIRHLTAYWLTVNTSPPLSTVPVVTRWDEGVPASRAPERGPGPSSAR